MLLKKKKKNETKWAGITAHTYVYLFAFNGKVTSVPVTSGCQDTTWVMTKPKFLTFEMEYFRKKTGYLSDVRKPSRVELN